MARKADPKATLEAQLAACDTALEEQRRQRAQVQSQLREFERKVLMKQRAALRLVAEAYGLAAMPTEVLEKELRRLAGAWRPEGQDVAAPLAICPAKKDAV